MIVLRCCSCCSWQIWIGVVLFPVLILAFKFSVRFCRSTWKTTGAHRAGQKERHKKKWESFHSESAHQRPQDEPLAGGWGYPSPEA